MADPASLSALFASILAAGEAAAGAVGTAAVGTGTAGAGAVGLTAGTAGTVAAGGLTTLQALSLASAAAGVAGTTAQLMADKPKQPNIPRVSIADEAQREAELRSQLYKRRGRAATLLTAGGAQGDVSAPTLGTASLLGA